jgi:AbrB family looped-hinge helix DNA binding protein
MQQIVSITSQGQLTIPKGMRKAFGLNGATRAVIEKNGEVMVVRPAKSFWSLEGSLASEVKLTDVQLKEAREAFSKSWGRND